MVPTVTSFLWHLSWLHLTSLPQLLLFYNMDLVSIKYYLLKPFKRQGAKHQPCVTCLYAQASLV